MQFAYRIDRWDADGNGVMEHLADIDDLIVAWATYEAARNRWPDERITLRQADRIIEDSRQNTVAGLREGHAFALGSRDPDSRRR